MSTCISHEGEYGEHEPGDWCPRCGAFNEEAIVAERDALRAQLDAMTVERTTVPQFVTDKDTGGNRLDLLPRPRGHFEFPLMKRLVGPWTAGEDSEGSRMDSSNAEKRETVVERAWREHPDEMARAHTEFQVAELTRLLAESRARFADSEARRAELEAVIEKVRGLIHERTFAEMLSRDFAGNWWPQIVAMDDLRDALSDAPSVVLEDRDREVAARALEDFADRWSRWIVADALQVRGGAAYRARMVAAAIRKGDTNA